MDAVTPTQIAEFIGQADNEDVVGLAEAALPVITAMVAAYTRDQGFTDGEPNPSLAAVITTATARLVANPEQLRHTVGGAQMLDGFQGFSLAETFVLNRYRARAL